MSPLQTTSYAVACSEYYIAVDDDAQRARRRIGESLRRFWFGGAGNGGFVK